MKEKILIIRLSSIGDIVLTSPVIRALRRSFPDAELHFLVKPNFLSVIEHHPEINYIHLWESSLTANIARLRALKFTRIVDLHNNLKSDVIKRTLLLPACTVDKKNFTKWRITNLKSPLKVKHFTDRCLECLKPWGVEPDGQGLDFYTSKMAQTQADTLFNTYFANSNQPIAIVLGATKGTKKWLDPYFEELIQILDVSFILLGGKQESRLAQTITQKFIQTTQTRYYNAVGKHDLSTSAELLRRCRFVITHDTGLMHIAAAFHKKTAVIWGNTTPRLGMTPYQTDYINIETRGLSCRPCSKIGYSSCPKDHFKCMADITPEMVVNRVEKWL